MCFTSLPPRVMHDDSNMVPAVGKSSAISLTSQANDGVTHGEVSAFFAKLFRSTTRGGNDPVATLIPWVCDVLQSKQSVMAYGRDLSSFLCAMRDQGIEPLAVNADHVKLFKRAQQEAGRCPTSIARSLSVIRGAYRQFAEKGLVRWDIVQDIAAIKAPRVDKNTTPALTEQQAVRLLHAIDISTLQGIRDRAMIHSLFLTACRVSAIVGACVGHLEFDGNDFFLHVTEKRMKKRRLILLDAARSVSEYLDRGGIRDDREGPLFRPVSKDGKTLLRSHLNRGSVWRLVRSYCKKAGIEAARLGSRGIGVHSLRKTALNNAIQNGAQMHEVRELAGHSDIRTTELYFVRKEEDAERAARRIQIR